MSFIAGSVFISHSSKDKEIVDKVVEIFEMQKIKCWISSRDIPPGSDWGEEIIKGMNAGTAFLVIITENSDKSPEVHKEVLAADKKKIRKYGIVINNHVLSGFMEYHFSNIQLENLNTPISREQLDDIIAAIKSRGSELPVSKTDDQINSNIKHNLPALMPMIGRETELEEIYISLGKEVQHYLVLGITGIGKKTLANNVAYKLLRDKFYDVIIWLTAQDGSLNFSSFLEQIALIFDDQYMNRLEPRERENAALNLLQNKAVLFVINGLHEVYDKKVLQFINRFTYDDAVLITSDVNTYLFDNCKTLTLNGLSKDEVRKLVQMEGDRIGIPNIAKLPENAFNEFHRLTTGNPYVIKLSIGQIKAGIPFERILLGLRQARGRVFEDVFAKSWSVLDDDQKELLMCLSIFRGSSSSAALQEISGSEDWDFVEEISKLINLSLVNTNCAFLTESIRYSMLPLTRSFAKRKLEDSLYKDEYTQNFVSFFSKYTNENQKNYKFLTNELENLRFMLEWLKDNQPMNHLLMVRKLYPYLRDTGYWDEAIENYIIAIEANRAAIEIESDVSFARCEIVSLYIRCGGLEDLNKSNVLLDEAIKVFERIDNQKGLCAALGRKARVAQKRKEYSLALEIALEALRIAQENNFQARIADLSHEIGDSYFYLGNYEQAKESYSNSLEIFKALGNPVRTIGRYNDLGRLESKMGNLNEAHSLLLQSIKLAEEHNKLDTLCRAYINIAETLFLQGDLELAEGYANKGENLALRLRAHQESEAAKIILEKIRNGVKELPFLDNLQAT